MEPSGEKTYRTEIEVRGYELDSFGHVNHANYLNYFEFARWRLLAEENVTLADFRRWDRFPVIANIDIRYLRPVTMGDRLIVETRILSLGRSSTQFEQKILRNGLEACVAKVRSVLVDGTGKPAEGPPEFRSRFPHLTANGDKT